MEYSTENWRMEKVLTLEQAANVASRLREQNKRIVTVNGSFDILHAGHLDQLEQAKGQGDVLFVGINTDVAIRQEKGSNRPIIAELPRIAMLAALTCVDYVVIMPGTYQAEPHSFLLPAIKPHVHVNGPDRGPVDTWTEWPVMQQLGIEGVTAVKHNDLSTSALLHKACKES